MQSKPLAAKVADIRPGIREDDGTGVFLRGAGQMAIVFAFGLFCGCLFTPRPTFAEGQRGERSVVEVSRLSVALLIAVFGLVAGAKDQLLKLDVLPGLAAVFVAGYGVDTLKNLMSTGKSS